MYFKIFFIFAFIMGKVNKITLVDCRTKLGAAFGPDG